MRLTKNRVFTCDLPISVVFKIKTNQKRERTVNPTTCFIQIIRRLIKKHHFKFSHNWYISHNHNFFKKKKFEEETKKRAAHGPINSSKQWYPTKKKHRSPNLIINTITEFIKAHNIVNCHTKKLNQTKFQNKNQRNPNYPEDHTHYKHHNNPPN